MPKIDRWLQRFDPSEHKGRFRHWKGFQKRRKGASRRGIFQYIRGKIGESNDRMTTENEFHGEPLFARYLSGQELTKAFQYVNCFPANQKPQAISILDRACQYDLPVDNIIETELTSNPEFQVLYNLIL